MPITISLSYSSRNKGRNSISSSLIFVYSNPTCRWMVICYLGDCSFWRRFHFEFWKRFGPREYLLIFTANCGDSIPHITLFATMHARKLHADSNSIVPRFGFSSTRLWYIADSISIIWQHMTWMHFRRVYARCYDKFCIRSCHNCSIRVSFCRTCVYNQYVIWHRYHITRSKKLILGCIASNGEPCGLATLRRNDITAFRHITTDPFS